MVSKSACGDMKAGIKKWTKRVLLFLIVIAVITKVYFEIGNYYFESNLEKMEANNELTVDIKSPIEDKILEMDGYDIHYHVSGNEHERSVVFLHAAFSDHSAFDQQIDYFSEGYKVITIDLMGHGLSKANKSKDRIDVSPEHILKILKAESITETNLVGVSVGSLIAQYFALKYPSNVRSLTAVGGYDINKKNKEVAKVQRSSNISLLLRAVFSMKAFRRKAAEITCHSERGRALFYKTAQHYERKSFPCMQGLQNVIEDRPEIEVNYPRLIMVGEYDVDLAKKMAKKWHEEEQNTEYCVIMNAGHCVNIDEPIAFNERVKTFIDKHNE